MDLNNRLVTLDMDSCDLYEIFLHEISKKIDEGKNEEILKMVKYGIKIKFDFENFVKERYSKKKYVKQKNGREVGDDIVKIKIEKQEFKEDEFNDEIFERVRLMRGWIWENTTIEKIGDFRKTGEEKSGE